MADLFVGRQPICDRNLTVHSYELLYRSGVTATAGVVDGDNASATVAINLLVEMGLDNLVGDRLAFVNMTRNFLVGGYYRGLPAGRVVLEVLEDITVDDELLDALREARREGYAIALDDYLHRPGDEELLGLAHFVKVDVMQAGHDGLKEQARLLKATGAKLLAEKVETPADFELCKNSGYDLFQGYFFCRPKVIRRKGIPADRHSLIQLLAQIQDPNTDFEDIEELIKRNVSLSYKLIRYVNSALYALPRKIESIHQAVVMLGLERVRTCVTLLLMAAVDEKPRELLVTALVRARHCQLLAEATTGRPDHVFFTVGLLSVVDALVDMPMVELLQSVPLAEPVKHAILEYRGPAGRALLGALCCEQGDFDRLLGLDDVDIELVQRCYVDALAWACSGAGRTVLAAG